MNDKLRRLKSTYKKEVGVVAETAASRVLILSFVKEEIKTQLNFGINDLTVTQLNATKRLITYIDEKLVEGDSIAGTFNEKEKYRSFVNEIDQFLRRYPFIKTSFDKILCTEELQHQEVKRAIVRYLDGVNKNLNEKEIEGINPMTPH